MICTIYEELWEFVTLDIEQTKEAERIKYSFAVLAEKKNCRMDACKDHSTGGAWVQKKNENRRLYIDTLNDDSVLSKSYKTNFTL